MDRQIQSGHASELSPEMYQLGTDFQVGMPLARYNMRSQVLLKYKRHNLIMLIGGICLFLVGLIAVLYETILLEKQISHTPNALIECFLPLGLGFIYSIGAIAQMWLVAGMLPAYALVYTEGLLIVRPKKVDVTRWKEVTDLRSIQRTKKSKKYKLSRMNRRSLFFGEVWEDVEDLVGLLRQQIKRDGDDLC